MEKFEEMNPAEENAGEDTKEKTGKVCSCCGMFLSEECEFCPKCGTPRVNKNICRKCGAELKEGQRFCHKCGRKAGLAADANASSDINYSGSGVDDRNKKKRKAPIIIGAAAAVIVLLAVAGIKFVPGMLLDSAGYLEKGNYEKAWEKAKTDEEKQNVINAYLAAGDYEKAWEKSESEDQKQSVIDFCLDKGNLDEAWKRSETKEQKQRVIDAYFDNGDLEKAWEKSETEEQKQRIIDAYLDKGDLEKAWEKSETEEQKLKVTDAYLDSGDYEEAYEKAPTAAKRKEIKAENVAAFYSAFSADNLKDPSSFFLRDVYYNEGVMEDIHSGQLVLYISGSNSFGASVSSYWLYIWDEDSNDWDYFTTVSSLEEEEYSIYDDEEEITEKYINNICRISIRSTMSDGIKLSKDAVTRINTMFENETLDKVKLMDMELSSFV